MRRLVLLGSTGSIGRATLEVVDHLGDVQVVGLAARRNVEGLAAQVARYRPQAVAVEDVASAHRLRGLLPAGTALLAGPEAIAELAAHPAADMVLVAVVGIAGLVPTLAALRAGKDVALATKEALVAGGSLVMAQARARGAALLPVDSEHSAIFQCLQGVSREAVRRIILTASGGPFLHRPLETLGEATPEEALAHPTWKMGPKVTVDSATLMNKGLEVIEARWLFDLPPERIDVVIHPQSLVHGMVELVDGSVLAQIAAPDMRLPIQLALTFPERRSSPLRPLAWERGGGVTMTFTPPPPERYPCLALAREALQAGGTAPAVVNAANEVVVRLFLERRISFGEIPRLLRRTLDAHRVVADPTLEDVLAADAWARETVTRFGAEVRR
ncbi:MAG: 1-deoxy-D-xylulose-5-phosphate reductoisomerase [Armatimonadota bacterium]|nr:1-deoxy-D-xylulose-5-phosphate reductoisomerase [Armatimonadota bacterium]MDR7428038.1 1-deoxy-D-xylulose-5-phosphate reductoisomerase [Armatimonadota bacterium]MDR7464261.1 1-deoxy-D-xylulose-5-phosphate reductoisomerase [Armatimonadota bacterium]MDR7474447.1 1-deoxy-D-xylulose-5-phosphate reductoisomerase [Armatimonadota bacterium]MDR7538778.1 1-deoxy-D-xylulose-5-phosphate reductoisomerase [Armatimonadota bacterium]